MGILFTDIFLKKNFITNIYVIRNINSMEKYTDILFIILKEYIKNYNKKYLFDIKENILYYMQFIMF